MELKVINFNLPKDANVILGQSHFIKTVEDLYEAIVTTNSNIKFGVAFNEASGPCLVRYDGNDEELIQSAIENIKDIGAGHTFTIVMKNGFPINILNQVKNVQEVTHIYAATANPLQVIVAETDLGRGIMGVIDGYSPKGIEDEKAKKEKYDFLRNITGYKR